MEMKLEGPAQNKNKTKYTDSWIQQCNDSLIHDTEGNNLSHVTNNSRNNLSSVASRWAATHIVTLRHGTWVAVATTWGKKLPNDHSEPGKGVVVFIAHTEIYTDCKP